MRDRRDRTGEDKSKWLAEYLTEVLDIYVVGTVRGQR